MKWWRAMLSIVTCVSGPKNDETKTWSSPVMQAALNTGRAEHGHYRDSATGRTRDRFVDHRYELHQATSVACDLLRTLNLSRQCAGCSGSECAYAIPRGLWCRSEEHTSELQS